MKNNVMKKSLILILLVIMAFTVMLFSGCNADNNNRAIQEGNNDESGDAPQVVLNPTNRKIIYSVDVEIVTDDYDKAIDDLYDFIFSNEQDGHWISSDRENSYGKNDKHRELTIRIKTEKLNDFLSLLSGMGEINYYNLLTEDITYSYADAQAKKTALQEQKAYYQGILADLQEESLTNPENYRLAEEINSKILEINSKIKLINDELIKYDNELDYSTVNLSINSLNAPASKPSATLSFGARIKKAFVDTFAFLGKAFKVLVIALVYILPFAAIGVVVFFAIFFINKKVVARKKGREKMNKIKEDMTKK